MYPLSDIVETLRTALKDFVAGEASVEQGAPEDSRLQLKVLVLRNAGKFKIIEINYEQALLDLLAVNSN
jgi:hypothetical protein